MRYHVYLEPDDDAGYLAHVPELIGCAARGKTPDETLARTREAIAAIRAVQRKHGGAVPPADEVIEFDVTETQGATLPSDWTPFRDAELEDLWERAAFARQELLDALNGMPTHALEYKPNENAWTIRNILAHVAQADLYFASRLEEGGLREMIWRLSATRALLLQHLQALPAAQRDHATQHGGEDWTPRKVARRMLEHEQEHLDQIREILKQAN